MNEALFCGDERRRDAVRRAHRLNGLDYVEVGESKDTLNTLTVYFLGKAPRHIAKENVRIDGGTRIRGIEVVRLDLECEEDPEVDDRMVVTVDKLGDFSTYTLRVVEVVNGHPTDRPLAHFDPRYSTLEFTFKVDCPSELDCAPVDACPPPARVPPELNYLAKDYASFRQLILDRLALVMPEWHERHASDLGITLVEILAYVGDHLSYYQDAVATEAYIGTARQRISVRRHAQLVDYRLHEGCNARVFVCVGVQQDVLLDPRQISFITRYSEGVPDGAVLAADDLRIVSHGAYEVFEPLIGRLPDFGPGDFRDLARLVRKLREPGDTLTHYLRDQLPTPTEALIRSFDSEGPPSEALRDALIEALNQALRGDDLYSKQRFPKIDDPQLRRQAAQHLRGEQLIRVNRLLLERAFDDEIEPMDRVHLYAAHNDLYFHTWQDRQCCLAKGATSATLRDRWLPVSEPASPAQTTQGKRQQQPEQQGVGEPAPQRATAQRALRLHPGDVLIFEEILGAKSGDPADADPGHRHAVRLTRVTPTVDPVDETPVVEIEWGLEDALPFPLCISALGPPPACELIENISIARGNIVLADHGWTVLQPEALGCVSAVESPAVCESERIPPETAVAAGRFTARLQRMPLTFAERLQPNASATAWMSRDPRLAVPQIWLTGRRLGPAGWDTTSWTARADLLGSYPLDRHFVVEVDNGGVAHLRFGDGELGRRPEARTRFEAIYRIGNGPAGNIGADTISHVVFKTPTSGMPLRPRNPLPGQGGSAPETIANAKRMAPHAFRNQLQRAISAGDYARLAERHPKVQRAAAQLRWLGSGYEVLVAIDPLGEAVAGDALLGEVGRLLEPYRRIGHRLRIAAAVYVPLRVELTISVKPHYLRGHVEAELLDVLGNRILPNGTRGLFHPDSLSFGEGIFLSRIVGAAQAVTGVESVMVDDFSRYFEPSRDAIDTGVLVLDPFEIACLDNDPSLPERGVLRLNMRGGR